MAWRTERGEYARHIFRCAGAMFLPFTRLIHYTDLLHKEKSHVTTGIQHNGKFGNYSLEKFLSQRFRFYYRQMENPQQKAQDQAQQLYGMARV
jgi:hypothetical protein